MRVDVGEFEDLEKISDELVTTGMQEEQEYTIDSSNSGDK